MFDTNIKTAWGQVTEDDLAMGVKAYPTYNAILNALAKHYDAGFVQTVEAFVALSPNNDYHGNLRSLVTLLKARATGRTFADCTISTYRGCGTRAWSYLSGEISFSDIVKGRKITSFRHNILYPDSSPLVTVDGHMIALGVGDKLTMKEANFRLREVGTYDAIEGSVRGLARKIGAPVPAVQATLWTSRKRRMGIKFDGQIDLFTGTTRWDQVLTPADVLPYAIK